MQRPSLEVADIFHQHGAAWRDSQRGHLNLSQRKVMSAIELCRTAALGGHVLRCDGCATELVSYNSCRNRNCPRCQSAAAKRWLDARQADLLYVIAGAALSSAYRMDENNQDGLRLILLDEAFDKMDTPNIVATMRYLEKLGLQVLLASPGENLPTLTAFLHRYFEIMKDETRHVIQVEERRVSEAMREQFREDMWEYHPELLEAELLAVRQEPVASFVAVPAP